MKILFFGGLVLIIIGLVLTLRQVDDFLGYYNTVNTIVVDCYLKDPGNFLNKISRGNNYCWSGVISSSIFYGMIVVGGVIIYKSLKFDKTSKR